MSAITIVLLAFLCLFLTGGEGHDQVSTNDMSKRNVNLDGIKNLLLAEIRRNIPMDIQGKSRDLRYILIEANLNELQLPQSDIRIKRFNPRTVEWTARDGKLKGETYWWFRYKPWRMDIGHVSFSTKSIGFNVTAVLEGNSIRVRNCFSNPPSEDLRIKGPLWWLIYQRVIMDSKNDFRKMLAGSNGLICKSVKRVLDRGGIAVLKLFKNLNG